MKLFVTGICGRLGRALVAEATEQGIEVIGLDQVPWPADRKLPPGVTTLEGSYTDLELVRRHLAGCDAIVHTAGPNGEHVKKLGYADFIDLNVTALAKLLELCQELGVNRAVISSTMEVMVGRDWSPSGAAIVDEDFAPMTDGRYATSRLLAETLGREYARQTGMSIASLRYMAFGYGRDESLGVNLLARSVASSDVARAVILAATKGPFEGDVIHIGPDTPLTNHDIIAAQSDPWAVVEKYYPGATEVLKRNGAELRWTNFWPATRIVKAKRLLGWQPRYTFDGWLKRHGWKQAPAAATAE